VETAAPCLVAFGQRVVALRRSQSLSQQALAHKAGLDPTYLSGVEQGRRNLGLINVWKLADALNVTPAAFFEHARADRSVPPDA
jgi:transcriptional regulator with XRE-family HTH domain